MSRQAEQRARILRIADGLIRKVLPDIGWARYCERCCEDLHKGASSISYFDSSWLCFACKIDEMGAPGYPIAERAYWQAIEAGELGYRGVGMSAGDRSWLASRYKLRRAVVEAAVN